MKRPHWYSEHEVSLIFLHEILPPSFIDAFCFLFSLGSVWQGALFQRQCVTYRRVMRKRVSLYTGSVSAACECMCALNRPLAGCQKRVAAVVAKTQNALAHLPPDELFIALDLSTTLYFYSCHSDRANLYGGNKQNIKTRRK